jgi:papain like protease/peptidase C1-like protein
MNKIVRNTILAAAMLLIASSGLMAQKKKKKDAPEGYKFTIEKSVQVTPVKDQHRSGTCWCFASTSFIEAELLRAGQGSHDLSEMYYVRKAWELKADKYVRMHGETNFSEGGLALDVIHMWKEFGMMPESAFPGNAQGDSLPVTGEMNSVLRGYVDGVIKNRNRSLTPVWKEGFNGILDAYIGEVPKEFDYQGASYTARSFADGSGLNPDDYVAVGSFTHHPFYKPFILEIPDNWIWGSIQNVPLDALMGILDNAIETGYSVCWDADVSEKGFSWKTGVALVPSTEICDLSGLERSRWDELSEKEQQELFYDFSTPKKEKVISQELRQQWFDNYQTTDDHLMHITARASDQEGNSFYRVKNSWGTGNHVYEGYFYASESFMRAKTIFFMVHKDAIPVSLAEKMGL